MTTRLRAICISILYTVLMVLLLTDIAPLVIFTEGPQRQVGSYFLLFLFLAIGTAWVLFFKSKDRSLLGLSMFPPIILLPYQLYVDTLWQQLNNDFGRVLGLTIILLITTSLTYVLLLTANLLSGYVIYNVPLGMAARAVQFIVTLISAYFLFTYMHASSLSPVLQVFTLFASTFITTYVATIGVYTKEHQQLYVSFLVSLVLLVIAFFILVWPLESVFATLVYIICNYLLLNMVLETREKITELIWVEYILLFGVVAFILITNANWGILGLILL